MGTVTVACVMPQGLRAGQHDDIRCEGKHLANEPLDDGADFRPQTWRKSEETTSVPELSR